MWLTSRLGISPLKAESPCTELGASITGKRLSRKTAVYWYSAKPCGIPPTSDLQREGHDGHAGKLVTGASRLSSLRQSINH